VPRLTEVLRIELAREHVFAVRREGGREHDVGVGELLRRRFILDRVERVIELGERILGQIDGVAVGSGDRRQQRLDARLMNAFVVQPEHLLIELRVQLLDVLPVVGGHTRWCIARQALRDRRFRFGSGHAHVGLLLRRSPVAAYFAPC